MKTRHILLNAVLAAGTVGLPAVGAAGQVRQADDPQNRTADGRVNNRVGGELYGNNTNKQQRLPYQTKLLPSEERYAEWRSGALPSEIRYYREAFGPLVPNGVIDYLPSLSPVQRAMGMRPPELYNPGYELSREANRDDRFTPRPGGSTLEDAPGVREAQEQRQAAVRRAMRDSQIAGDGRIITGKPLPTGQLPSGMVDARVKPIPPAETQQDLPPYPETWMNRRIARPAEGPKPATQPTSQPATRPYPEEGK